MNNEILNRIKLIIKENEIPFFTDEEIEQYYNMKNSNFNNTVYELLIRKSEMTTLAISGLTTQDTSSYFKRLASMYYPSNSGNI